MYKYLEFLNEGNSSNANFIYWKDQLNKIIDEDWKNISVKNRGKNSFTYVSFSVKDNIFGVILESGIKEDTYYLEDGIEDIFIKKFYSEFWKSPDTYFKKMDYKPKCLGDLSHIGLSIKYNL